MPPPCSLQPTVCVSARPCQQERHSQPSDHPCPHRSDRCCGSLCRPVLSQPATLSRTAADTRQGGCSLLHRLEPVLHVCDERDDHFCYRKVCLFPRILCWILLPHRLLSEQSARRGNTDVINGLLLCVVAVSNHLPGHFYANHLLHGRSEPTIQPLPNGCCLCHTLCSLRDGTPHAPAVIVRPWGPWWRASLRVSRSPWPFFPSSSSPSSSTLASS